MNLEHLMAARWDELDERTAEATAVDLAAEVGGRFLELAYDEIGGARSRTALLSVSDLTMALIPGGTFELGWKGDPIDPDVARVWRECRSLLAEPHLVERALAELGGADVAPARDMPGEIEAWFSTVLSPRRTVVLAPFLMEVEPADADDVLAELDDEAIEEQDSAHADIELVVAGQGFRLPQPDEWERAVQAEGGVFRWGDQWPLDSHPVHGGPFTRHAERGRFGLKITNDPYRAEVTSVPTIMKGGDGGSIVCSGVGPPLCWITFATAWVFDLTGLEDRNGCFEGAGVRRVLSIPARDGAVR